MASANNNTYAFDECSILHLCEIKINNAFVNFFSKDKLTHRNHSKLKSFIGKLDFKGISKYRFEPLNLGINIIKFAEELLAKEGNQITILGQTLKSQITDQLEEFSEDMMINFKKILKDENIGSIKELFINNEKELKRSKNIPEDDDLKVIAGYYNFNCEGKKYLISEDEHFWGYDDLIFDNFNIKIVKEWECHNIMI